MRTPKGDFGINLIYCLMSLKTGLIRGFGRRLLKLLLFFIRDSTVLVVSVLLCVSCPSATEFSAILFYFLPDQAQTHLDHFNVLDELWGEISSGFDNR